jgi:formate dehydrogenase subunit delta
MNDQDLIRMANQIADYYKAYPQEEAVAGIAAHIRSFWDPRMRAGLARHIATGGKGLSPLALAAARCMLEPPASGEGHAPHPLPTVGRSHARG